MTRQQSLTLLDADYTTDEETVGRNFRELIRIWHPDNFASKPDLAARATAQTAQLNEAWEVYQQHKALPPPKPASRPKFDLLGMGTVVVLGLLAALGFYGYLTHADLGQPELQLAKTLAGISYQTNLDLPVALDDETKFTATFAGPGHRFTSIYTLTKVTKEQIGPSYFEEIRPAMVAHVKAQRLTNPAMATFEKNGVTLAFAFRDKQGADILTIDVEPEEYRLEAALP